MKIKLVSLLLIAAITPAVALADSMKGLEIAKERKARDIGWNDSTATVTMILRNSQGEQSIRKMRTMSLEVKEDGDKGLTIFDEPGDVRGSAFLTYSHIKDADDQWLYLPALKRVKRIASKNKSGPFMGSEFSYEDLSSFEIEKYQFMYIKDESLEGIDCYLVEQTPVDSNSGYKRELIWLDKVEYRPMRIEYYDRKNSLLKVLTLTDYTLYQNKYWRAHTLDMVNKQSGKSTELKTENIRFNTGLQDRDFHQNVLTRLH
uniref:Outer membrane lipoprotein-sorting protein n=2 Tax=Vibrio ziniensis TaxID=2711221 RepID=A0A6G7CR01_9VIBR|nr:outer membrane lipoprotein-sorting protein [Vibrio ziniensis]QIH44510.1 outer membrane lipoprotein-sorting protein [Vibrio ziniensis]